MGQMGQKLHGLSHGGLSTGQMGQKFRGFAHDELSTGRAGQKNHNTFRLRRRGAGQTGQANAELSCILSRPERRRGQQG